MCDNQKNTITTKATSENISCPVCKKEMTYDEITFCKHVVFVDDGYVFWRYNYNNGNDTKEMDNYLDSVIGDDPCRGMSEEEHKGFCEKFNVKLGSIEVHLDEGFPKDFQMTFGFKE